MEQHQKEELLDILCGLHCDKDFVCYTSGQIKLCKAEDVGFESYLVCLQEHPEECKFSVKVFGDKHLCQCPLRVHLAKNMKK